MGICILLCILQQGMHNECKGLRQKKKLELQIVVRDIQCHRRASDRDNKSPLLSLPPSSSASSHSVSKSLCLDQYGLPYCSHKRHSNKENHVGMQGQSCREESVAVFAFTGCAHHLCNNRQSFFRLLFNLNTQIILLNFSRYLLTSVRFHLCQFQFSTF